MSACSCGSPFALPEGSGALVSSQYYKVKGMKDKDRYRSMSESAVAAGLVEIKEEYKLWKLRLTSMGVKYVKSKSDEDALRGD